MLKATRRCLVTVLLTALSVPAATTIEAVLRADEIKIDGVLGEAAWSKAVWQTNFLSASAASDNAGEPRPVPVQTRFKVLYDADETIMPPVAAFFSHPQSSQRKGKVIHNHQDVFQGDVLLLHPIPYGFAAKVHIG